ncbi:MAG: hypothetical protein R2849_09935 [Thermomicrobiales bacterium]
MEIGEGYTERTHRSLYALLKLEDEDASLLVWTTTPDTARQPSRQRSTSEPTYVKVEQHGEIFTWPKKRSSTPCAASTPNSTRSRVPNLRRADLHRALRPPAGQCRCQTSGHPLGGCRG